MQALFAVAIIFGFCVVYWPVFLVMTKFVFGLESSKIAKKTFCLLACWMLSI